MCVRACVRACVRVYKLEFVDEFFTHTHTRIHTTQPLHPAMRMSTYEMLTSVTVPPAKLGQYTKSDATN